VLAAGAAVRAPEVSPLDEWTHVDYAWNLAHGHIPAAGDDIDPEVLADFSCRGVANDAAVPPCGADAPASSYPWRGENYNFNHPPLYYLITGVLAGAVDLVLPGRHFWTLARLTGVLWLWAGMIALFVAARRWGASAGAALGAALALTLLPTALTASSIVTNDAPALLAGGLALALASDVVARKPVDWRVAAALAALVSATKIMNAVPFIALAVLAAGMAIASWRSGDRSAAKRQLTVGVSIGGAILVVYAGWLAFQSVRGEPGWVSPVLGVHGKPLTGAPFDEWLPAMVQGLSLATPYTLAPRIDTSGVATWAAAANLALVAFPAMTMMLSSRLGRRWFLGAATLGALAGYPVLAELQIYLNDGDYFPTLAARYGLSLLPWALCCVAVVVTARTMRWAPLAALAIGVGTMTAAVFLSG
jgi:hypothetical protein